MRGYLATFSGNEEGVTAVETAFLAFIFAVLLGGGLELGLTYYQGNAAEQAARSGARLAATHDPVASELSSQSFLGNGVVAGDPIPNYVYTCDGATQSCSQGSYDAEAMKVLLFGPDKQRCDERDNRAAQGMCDFIQGLEESNVEVRYTASGIGIAGQPAKPRPVITVTVKDVPQNYIFLERILGKNRTLSSVSVSMMAEDMKGGA